MDGYGKVSRYEGPYRNIAGEVVYYDPTNARYVLAKQVHQHAHLI